MDASARLEAHEERLDMEKASPLSALRFRNVGPEIQGGRVVEEIDARAESFAAAREHDRAHPGVGVEVPDGTYTISVTAKDVSGVGLTVSSEITGVVDAVDLSGETPVLSIGTVQVPIDKVKSLRANSST